MQHRKYFVCLSFLMLIYMAGRGQYNNKGADTIDVRWDNITDTAAMPDAFDTSFVIRNIILAGNRKTRPVIIYRELPFKKGGTIRIKDIPAKFAEGTSLLKNTQLFHDVMIALDKIDGQFLDIKVTVIERGYLFPAPYFKPVDRNLNQWLFDKGANLSRLDYGVKVLHSNVTGNNDKLRFYFITGYTQQITMGYQRPFIDKKMRWGVNVNIATGKNHELNYNTIDDKQAFLKNDNYQRNFFTTNVEFTYRKAYFTTHKFGIGYSAIRVSDSVVIKNPDYFGNGIQKAHIPELYYEIAYKNLDYSPYPTKGYAFNVHLEKSGFDRTINMWQLTAKGLGVWHLGPRLFYSVSAMGSVKVPFKQPYFNAQLLGYGDMSLNGYEYYVVDGVAGGLVNATLYKQLTNFSIRFPGFKRYIPRLIPIKIYGKVYGNTGYAYNPNPGISNELPNKMLYGGGFGLDLVTMYDFTFNINFSFNQLGQNGLFLHKKALY